MRYVDVKHTNHQPVADRSKKNRKNIQLFFIIGSLICLVMIIGLGSFFVFQKNARAKIVTTPTPLSTSAVRTMGSQINQTINSNKSIKTSISIIDLKSGGSYHYGSHDLFQGASVNKLISATLLLHTIDKKQNTIYTQIEGQKASPLLTKMIEDSDNEAWAAINHFLTPDALKEWAAQNNWSSYRYDTNEIASDDIARLLASMYNGNLLQQASRDIMLSHMHGANESNLIVKNAPQNSTVYHKAGWLDNTLNDAAVIDNGKRPVALVIFTEGEGIYSNGDAEDIFKEITTAVTTAFSTQ